MKKKILLFTGVLLIALFMYSYSMPYFCTFKGNGISETKSTTELQLQFEKGRYYEVGSRMPFTGKVRVNYEKEYINDEGDSDIKDAIFENEYIDGVIKNTNYYNKNGDLEYSVKKI